MRDNMLKIPILIVVLLIGILIGTYYKDYFGNNKLDRNSEKIMEVLSYTNKYYLEDVDSDKLIDAAIKGMLATLDPHTSYIPAIQQEISEEEFRGNFEGIGIEFQVVNDTITVVSPITGGPSESLGIQAGDRIIKIDGASSIGFNNQDVIKSLRGEKGTKVDVVIFRPPSKKEYNFTIERAEIPIFAVDASFIIGTDVGYISVSKFSETTTDEMLKALEKLKNQGMEKLILDLRNNPGGLLSQAYQVADFFIHGNKMIVYTEARVSDLSEKYYASRSYPYENIPLIILVNRGSASGSEIVAGAVQDWDRGLIVGETTFGKGLVQRPFILSDNSAVRITVSKYFTPSGRAIQRNYENGNDQYYQELYNRNLDSIKTVDDSAKTYRTDSGRVVYGGGGITPDHSVQLCELTDYTAELRRKNIYYLFIRKYLDSEKTNISNKFKNYKDFEANFKLGKKVSADFISFAENHGVSYSSKEFEKDKLYIRALLKAYIARDLWKNDGWYYVLLQTDKQFIKAAALFEEAAKLANLN
ncbi:MAG: S41 family peptidase [Bacteroidetes bacterium]|nr:S41 family peptidase [Bacteroidota bacterium]MBU1678405.1 S41 family peptidase [Bacteroidota bacterium]MBU2508499.1 S41 family peptidase [Bacteroidota bacterium]